MQTLRDLATQLLEIQQLQNRDRETFKEIFLLLQKLSERQGVVTQNTSRELGFSQNEIMEVEHHVR